MTDKSKIDEEIDKRLTIHWAMCCYCQKEHGKPGMQNVAQEYVNVETAKIINQIKLAVLDEMEKLKDCVANADQKRLWFVRIDDIRKLLET